MYRPGCEVMKGEFINVRVPGYFINCWSLGVECGNIVFCGIFACCIVGACI